MQQVLVPLDKPLRVDLPVLDLLLPISLDSLEQGLQALLVPLSELLHLSEQGDLQVLIHDCCLVLLLLLYHGSHGVRLIVIFD